MQVYRSERGGWGRGGINIQFHRAKSIQFTFTIVYNCVVYRSVDYNHSLQQKLCTL